MSVSGMLQDKTDALDVLRQLVALKESDVIALQETQRKQIALTDEERTKAGEARTLIEKHQNILDSIKEENTKHEANQLELSSREEALKKERKDYDSYVTSKKEEHETNLKTIAEERKKFSEEIKFQEEKIRKANEGFQTQINEFKKEKERIAGLEQDARGAQDAAQAMKAKYEKKLAIIQQDI